MVDWEFGGVEQALAMVGWEAVRRDMEEGKRDLEREENVGPVSMSALQHIVLVLTISVLISGSVVSDLFSNDQKVQIWVCYGLMDH